MKRKVTALLTALLLTERTTLPAARTYLLTLLIGFVVLYYALPFMGQALQQLLLNALGPAHAHVDHQGLAGAGQSGPVEVAGFVLQMAGDEETGLRMLAMRQRNAGIGAAGQGGGDDGHGTGPQNPYFAGTQFF